MCGINGIFAHSCAVPVDETELTLTRDLMAARGPDGRGAWISDDRSIGLGHRRLAIIDLSEAGAQPMHSADGRFFVTFNGEIYNYRELRSGLEAKGRVFRTSSDTEVLLYLYAERGEAMVHELRGMFAFAIWDGEKRRLFLARDPYGIKPLYYADDGRTFRFASQVKALAEGGGVSGDSDPAAWVAFYMLGHVPEPLTVHRAIRALPAGCTMSCEGNGMSESRRYSAIGEVYAAQSGRVPTLSPAATREAVRAALLDSVRQHLVADVPVGAFLSSGIDSGALVGLMRDAGQSDIATVTLRFADFEGTDKDESPLASVVAQSYDVRHSTRTVTRREFQDDLPKILAAMDQPSIDGINTWFVAKAAHEFGLKVVISGLGGDELFRGYPSFSDIPRWVRQLQWLNRARLLGPSLRRLAQMGGFDRIGRSPKAVAVLEYGGSFAGAYFARRGLFMPWELTGDLDADFVREGLSGFDVVEQARTCLQPDPGSDFARVATLESSLYMRNQLLRDTDWASMAHSLEVRVPLVDHDLLRSMAEIGASAISGEAGPSKRLLAEAPSRPLPREVLVRSKTGFNVPVESWVGVQEHQAGWRGATQLRSRGWARHVARNFAVRGMQRPLLANTARRSPVSMASGASPRPLRILMLVSDAHGGFGGIARHNCDVIEVLSQSDRIAEVLVLPRVVTGSTGALPAKVSYDIRSASGIWPFLMCCAAYGLLVRRFDVIHCGHINLMPIAALLGWLRRVPVSLVIHGIDAWRPTGNVSARWTANRASLIISVSALTLGRFAKWTGYPADRSLVIPNTVQSDIFLPGEKDATLVKSLDLENRKVIMSLGRMSAMERQKGFDEVLSVMPNLVASQPNLVFLACGDGEDRPRLEAKARALGIAHAVRFPGKIPEEQKAAFFRLADAFVMPSSGEGFGIVLLEALSCGIPIVASSLDGTREAARDGELGIVADPRDNAALAAAITAAISQPKGVLAGLDYFSRPQFAARWVAAMTRAATSGSRAS